jgi:hypothetical protein
LESFESEPGMAIETELQTRRQFIDFIEDDVAVDLDLSDSKIDGQAISKSKILSQQIQVDSQSDFETDRSFEKTTRPPLAVNSNRSEGEIAAAELGAALGTDPDSPENTFRDNNSPLPHNHK